MSWLLCSPFHVFMGGMLLITVTGRKSGRAISTPVNYVRDGDTLLITSTVDRTWWRNLRGGAPVTLVMNGKTYRADAITIEQLPEREQELLRFFRLTRHTIAGIHLTPDGQPTKPEKFQRVVQKRIVINLTHLQEGAAYATASRV
jgi:deazaflavin-dependent oxidoreductase (nitroreductase family)